MNRPEQTGLAKLKNFFASEPKALFGDREVHLHLGAHKTATTFIQGILKQNNAKLLESGVFYLPLTQMRVTPQSDGKSITSRIISLSQANGPRAQIPQLRKDLLEAFQPEVLQTCHTILISEENLSLDLFGFLKGEAYSGMRQRLMHLRDELGCKLKVYFSIREYPDFISSVYVEILRHHPYVSFKDFLSGLYGEEPSLWSEAYACLVDLFGADNVTVWDFTDTIKNPQGVLSMLTGGIDGFAMKSKAARQSLSQKAVEFIRDFSKLPGEPVAASMVAKVAARLYPLSNSNGKFDPWTPREKRALHERYAQEAKPLVNRTF